MEGRGRGGGERTDIAQNSSSPAVLFWQTLKAFVDGDVFE